MSLLDWFRRGLLEYPDQVHRVFFGSLKCFSRNISVSLSVWPRPRPRPSPSDLDAGRGTCELFAYFLFYMMGEAGQACGHVSGTSGRDGRDILKLRCHYLLFVPYCVVQCSVVLCCAVVL